MIKSLQNIGGSPNLQNSIDVLKKAAEKTKYTRERYSDTLADSSSVLVFFGDERSRFILSSFVLPNMDNAPKIVCSRIREDYFFSVSEYWGCNQNIESDGFSGSGAMVQARLFERYFPEVIEGSEYSKFESLREVASEFNEIHFPAVGKFKKLKEGKKVFLVPSKHVLYWNCGKARRANAPKEFWIDLGKKIMQNGWIPVFSRNEWTYDVSPDIPEAIHVMGIGGTDTWALMRMCGMVIDFSQNLCYTAMQCKTPFVCMTDRKMHFSMGNDLFNLICDTGYDYIFSFPTMIESRGWAEIIGSVLSKLKTKTWSELMPCERSSSKIDCKKIIDVKLKKMGSSFFRVKLL